MSSQAREQALLSEYKGNLFEFLIAKSLANKLNLEMHFLTSLPAGFSEMLRIQESFIREFYPFLLTDLPVLAEKLSDELIKILKLKTSKITDIVIVGKSALAAQNTTFGEADIILKSNKKFFPISLKLSKENAFVNTKSAGLKSFFSKYFVELDEKHLNQIQKEFNQNVEFFISEFANEVHRNHDLSFNGNFDEWLSLGLPSLSGELNEKDREIYKELLYKINDCLYENVKTIFSKYSDSVAKCLWPLLGYSDKEVIQATSYYKSSKESYTHYKSVVELLESTIDSSGVFKLGDRKKTAANFDILAKDRTLQLRVKAMNKFTSKSFKINCSVKIN